MIDRQLLEKHFLKIDHSIRDALNALEVVGDGLLLIIDENTKLIGTLSDGDIRRAILAGAKLDEQCITFCNKKPLSIDQGFATEDVLGLMKVNEKGFHINQLPVLDRNGKVVDLILLKDFINEENIELSAVVMAGGFGTRLKPLTDDTPKPMLPVGDKPMLEHIIGNLNKSGISNVSITTHFHADKIKKHFGNGENFGINLSYVDEKEPLGTVGALSLMQKPNAPFFVINGDILSHLNFRNMAKFHQQHHATLTMAVRKFEFNVPYGVIEQDEVYVKRVTEKPCYSFFVNAGIYLLEPSIFEYVPDNKPFDMPDLINTLIVNEKKVLSFPITNAWIDIGTPEDYKKAQNFMTHEEETV